MIMHSILRKFTLLAATLVAGTVLLAATDGAQARGVGNSHGQMNTTQPVHPPYHCWACKTVWHPKHHDRDYHRPPLHGPGSSHNPIVNNPPSAAGLQGGVQAVPITEVRDHRPDANPPGGVTVTPGSSVYVGPPRWYDGRGYGFGGAVVRDHR